MGIEDSYGSDNNPQDRTPSELERRQELLDNARAEQAKANVIESKIIGLKKRNHEADTDDLEAELEKVRSEIRGASDEIKIIEGDPEVINKLRDEANIVKEKIEGPGGLLEKVIKLNGDTGEIRKEYLRGLIFRIIDSDLDRGSFKDEESINQFFQELESGLEDGKASRKGSEIHQMGQELRSFLGVGEYKSPVENPYLNFIGEKVNEQPKKKFGIYTPEVVNYVLAFADVLGEDKKQAFGDRFKFVSSEQHGELGFKHFVKAPADNEHLSSYYVPKEYTEAQLEQCRRYYESSKKYAQGAIAEYVEKQLQIIGPEFIEAKEKSTNLERRLEEINAKIKEHQRIIAQYSGDSSKPSLDAALSYLKSITQVDQTPTDDVAGTGRKPGLLSRLFRGAEKGQSQIHETDQATDQMKIDLAFLNENNNLYGNKQSIENDLKISRAVLSTLANQLTPIKGLAGKVGVELGEAYN